MKFSDARVGMRVVMTQAAQKEFSMTVENTRKGTIISLVQCSLLIRVKRDYLKSVRAYSLDWWKRAGKETMTDDYIFTNERPVLCIECQKTTLEIKDTFDDGDSIRTEVKCTSCGTKWVEDYKIVMVGYKKAKE